MLEILVASSLYCCCMAALSSMVWIFCTRIWPPGPCCSCVLGGSCCSARSCEPAPAGGPLVCTVTLGGARLGGAWGRGTGWITPPGLATGATPPAWGRSRPVVGERRGGAGCLAWGGVEAAPATCGVSTGMLGLPGTRTTLGNTAPRVTGGVTGPRAAAGRESKNSWSLAGGGAGGGAASCCCCRDSSSCEIWLSASSMSADSGVPGCGLLLAAPAGGSVSGGGAAAGARGAAVAGAGARMAAGSGCWMWTSCGWRLGLVPSP